jgi:hypothetical protein
MKFLEKDIDILLAGLVEAVLKLNYEVAQSNSHWAIFFKIKKHCICTAPQMLELKSDVWGVFLW